MARKSKKNPAYRTKEDMVKDIAFILNAPLTYGTKQVVCRQAAWEWTEFDGKYEGCPLWSKKAAERYAANPDTKLIHEHAVPKKVVADLLLSLESPSEALVRTALKKLLIAVVVTPEEDAILNQYFKSSMPPEFHDATSPSELDVPDSL